MRKTNSVFVIEQKKIAESNASKWIHGHGEMDKLLAKVSKNIGARLLLDDDDELSKFFSAMLFPNSLTRFNVLVPILLRTLESI